MKNLTMLVGLMAFASSSDFLFSENNMPRHKVHEENINKKKMNKVKKNKLKQQKISKKRNRR